MAKYRIFKKDGWYVIKKRNFLGFWNYVKNEYVDLFSFSTEEVKTFRTLNEAERYIHHLSKKSKKKLVKEVNYPPTVEPMGWASGVNTPSNLGSSS